MKSKEMAAGMGKSAGFVMLIGLLETLGAAGLILGFLTQWAALAVGVVMVGALYYKIFVWKTKFTGTNGWELDLALLTAAFVALVSGSGVWALDALVFTK